MSKGREIKVGEISGERGEGEEMSDGEGGQVGEMA